MTLNYVLALGGEFDVVLNLDGFNEIALASENIRDDLIGLRASHATGRLIVWTIPDITVTPGHCCSLSDMEIENLREHTERANAFIKVLARSTGVAVVDIFTLARQVVENPPIIFGHQLLPPPAYGDYGHLFADEIHPTAVSNALIANAIGEALRRKWGVNIPRYSEVELADLAHIPH